MGVQLAPNYIPPDWPNGNAQQVHLDFHVDDLASAHQEAIALGARLMQAAKDMTADEGNQVYADPAGHPFCLGWGQPDEEAVRNFLRKTPKPYRRSADLARCSAPAIVLASRSRSESSLCQVSLWKRPWARRNGGRVIGPAAGG